jgi:hypothetical protein
MRLKRPRLKRPQVEYIIIHRAHWGWAMVFLLGGWWVWLPLAYGSDTFGYKTVAYIVAALHFLIAARLFYVRPWFTWE